MIHVTAHAIERYQERVANLSDDIVTTILSAPVIQRAADFGAPYVRLVTGNRIVIQNHTVVTVLPKDTWPGSLAPGRHK